MPGAPINYAQVLGFDKCRDLALEQHAKHIAGRADRTNAINCWLHPSKGTTDKYIQIYAKKLADEHRSGRDSQTAFLLHVISYVGSRQQAVPPGHHVSHLCDIRHCFNPDHLIIETPILNNARKGCPGPLFCPKHGHEIINLCRHQPQCIRPPCEQLNCCLTIRHMANWADLPSSSRPASSQPGATASKDLQAMLRSSTSSRYSGGSTVEEAARMGWI